MRLESTEGNKCTTQKKKNKKLKQKRKKREQGKRKSRGDKLAGNLATSQLVENFSVRRPACQDFAPFFGVFVFVQAAVINHL